MEFFKNLKIGMKLMVAVLSVVAMTTILGIFSVVQLSKVNDVSTDISGHWLPSVQLLGRASMAINFVRRAALAHLLVSDREAMNRYERMMEQANAQLAEAESKYEKLIASDEERQAFTKMKAAYTAYADVHHQVVTLSQTLKKAEATALNIEAKKPFDATIEALEQNIEVSTKGAAVATRHAEEMYKSARILITVVLCVGALLGIALALIIAKMIGRALRTGVEMADRLAQGDLSMTIENPSRDEAGQLLSTMAVTVKSLQGVTAMAEDIAAGNLQVEVKPRSDADALMKALAAMVRKLSEVVVEVKGSADNVAAGSEQLSQSAQQLSQGATEQASSIEEVSSSMEEMSSNIKQNADNALQTEKIALKAAADAKEGGDAVARTVEAMKQIAQQDLHHRRDRPSDQPARAQRRHRSGTGGRAWPWLCRRRLRGPQAGRAQPEGRGRDHRAIRHQREGRGEGRRALVQDPSRRPEDGGAGARDRSGQPRARQRRRPDQQGDPAIGPGHPAECIGVGGDQLDLGKNWRGQAGQLQSGDRLLPGQRHGPRDQRRTHEVARRRCGQATGGLRGRAGTAQAQQRIGAQPRLRRRGCRLRRILSLGEVGHGKPTRNFELAVPDLQARSRALRRGHRQGSRGARIHDHDQGATHGPDFMRGVINLRGNVVPVVDMRLKLGSHHDRKNRRHLRRDLGGVGRRREHRPGRAGGLGPGGPRPRRQPSGPRPPHLGSRIDASVIRGMGRRDEQFIMILDLDRVFTSEDLRASGAALPGRSPGQGLPE